MHYRIEITPSLGFGRMELERSFKAYKPRFTRGSMLDPEAIPSPWIFTVEPNPGRELALNDYYPEFHLMSDRMLNVLRSAGASNLQAFPATINDVSTGHTIETYKVVNIVGLVACADQDVSDSLPVADKKYFLRLTIDEKQAAGLLIFRLEESRVDVIVNESIANAIRGAALRNIELEPVTGAG